MGIDAELYVWGEPIKEEKLALINQGFREVLGDKDLDRPGPIIEEKAWFDAVPGTALYYVDANGARYFHHDYHRGTGWPQALRRIELCQLHLPDHFILYLPDTVYVDEGDNTHHIVTDEFLRKQDEAYAEVSAERGW